MRKLLRALFFLLLLAFDAHAQTHVRLQNQVQHLNFLLTYHTAPPTANDDGNDGYIRGSRWVDTTSNVTYEAVGVTPGAALWRRYQPYNARLDDISASGVTDLSLVGGNGSTLGLYYSLLNCPAGPVTFTAATRAFGCGTYPGASISGTSGAIGKIGAGGNSVEDSACVEDADSVNCSKALELGNVAQSAKFARGGSITGQRIYTLARDTDGDVALTTGALTNGYTTALDSSGRIKDGGPVEITFTIDRDGGLVDSDSRPGFYPNFGTTKTITAVRCKVDNGSSTINLQLDDNATPNNILSSDLVCGTSWTTSTSFVGSENIVINGYAIDFAMIQAATSGTPTKLTVSILATK